MAEKGNYCLAILKVNEDYISLKTELKSFIDEMRDLSSMELQGKIINFVYYLGGDWKFLACVCVCGIGATNSTHAYIWCTCSKDERGGRGDLMWSTHNPQCMRIVENIEKWVTKGEYSTKHVPLQFYTNG